MTSAAELQLYLRIFDNQQGTDIAPGISDCAATGETNCIPCAGGILQCMLILKAEDLVFKGTGSIACYRSSCVTAGDHQTAILEDRRFIGFGCPVSGILQERCQTQITRFGATDRHCAVCIYIGTEIDLCSHQIRHRNGLIIDLYTVNGHDRTHIGRVNGIHTEGDIIFYVILDEVTRLGEHVYAFLGRHVAGTTELQFDAAILHDYHYTDIIPRIVDAGTCSEVNCVPRTGSIPQGLLILKAEDLILKGGCGVTCHHSRCIAGDHQAAILESGCCAGFGCPVCSILQQGVDQLDVGNLLCDLVCLKSFICRSEFL